MHQDVTALRDFYYRTTLGRSAQRRLQVALREVWPDTRGQIVAGYGFAVPFLRPFLKETERVLALMPAQQGVMPWPPGGNNICTLTEETAWPLPNGSIDRLMICHGLETCNRPEVLLAECARVLSPGGQIAFVVPNRAGAWSRSDRTPFGIGRPYSFGQVDDLLKANGFAPILHKAALYAPPSERRMMLRWAKVMEALGARQRLQSMAGALVVVARKEIFARPNLKAREVSRPLNLLGGLAPGLAEPSAQGRMAGRQHRDSRTHRGHSV